MNITKSIVLAATFLLAAAPLSRAQEEGAPAPKRGPGKPGSSLAGKQIVAMPPLPKEKQVWDSKPDSSATETVRVRVVDFGQVNCRGFEDVHLGDRFAKGDFLVAQTWNDFNYDVDGDSSTKDWVEYIPFSMKEPLSPEVPLWNNSHVSSKFYGGFAFLYANVTPRGRAGVTEQQVNANETDGLMQPANNWALHMLSDVKGSPYKACAAWIWKKEDFLHGADSPSAKVSFDSSSRIAHFNQRYYGGWEGIRFIVQDGDQFYVSEQMPNDFKTDCKVGCGGAQIRMMNPADVKWGKWNPKEGTFDMAFDSSTPMERHEFNDVRAIGWYIAKDALNEITVACKWEAFECYANVTRPKVQCEVLELKKIKEGTYLSSTEVPYQVWKEIFQMAAGGGQWVMEPEPSLFDKDGDMGSMDYGFEAHSQKEPVTDITLYDALVWCNSLSEYEGRDPVYYTDPDFMQVYRKAIESPWFTDPKLFERPVIYVKWAADGYRLPTPAEWSAAAGNAESVNQKSKTTQPAGSGAPNSLGLYDMAGNVWELLWTYGDVLKPDPGNITVAGGAFTGDGLTDPLAFSALPYGSKPYYGHFNIGFRVLRRDFGMADPEQGGGLPPALVWKIGQGDTAKAYTPEPVEIKLADIKGGAFKMTGEKKSVADYTMGDYKVGTVEVSYREWKKVRDWAESKGYSFDYDGDMGSMDYKNYINRYTPDEPVTGISLFDMMAWCNALSEMQGKNPVFFTDDKLTQVYRKSFRYRPANYRGADDSPSTQLEKFLWKKEGGKKVITFQPFQNLRETWGWNTVPRRVYMKWNNDGYRPPTMAEWSFAYTGGSGTAFPWGDRYEDIGDSAWYYWNSDSRTHETGKKNPNGYGLYDMAGNALEFCIDSDRKGGKAIVNAAVNPVKWMSPYEWSARWRATFLRTGFDYDAQNFVHSNPMKAENDTWGGAEPGWHWPDVGFRVAINPNYPEDALKPAAAGTGGKKALPVQPLNLNRKAGE